MGMEEVQRIKEIFSQLSLHPVYLEHEEVITSEDAAKTRGFELRQGIKSILLTNGSYEFVIVDVPADKKVDMKKAAAQMQWAPKLVRMATPDEVLSATGCLIGSVPPFGHKETIPVLVDAGVFENETSAFNIGLRTHSVKIPTAEMKIVFSHVGAVVGVFCKVDQPS